MMNPTKFSSLNFDTPSSRYEFWKFESISEKIKETLKTEIATCTRLTTPAVTDCWAPQVNGPHMSSTQKQGSGLTSGELVDSEATGGEVTTDVLPLTPHVEWYP